MLFELGIKGPRSLRFREPFVALGLPRQLAVAPPDDEAAALFQEQEGLVGIRWVLRVGQRLDSDS